VRIFISILKKIISPWPPKATGPTLHKSCCRGKNTGRGVERGERVDSEQPGTCRSHQLAGAVGPIRKSRSSYEPMKDLTWAADCAAAAAQSIGKLWINDYHSLLARLLDHEVHDVTRKSCTVTCWLSVCTARCKLLTQAHKLLFLWTTEPDRFSTRTAVGCIRNAESSA
jgi:hypothetical protein